MNFLSDQTNLKVLEDFLLKQNETSTKFLKYQMLNPFSLISINCKMYVYFKKILTIILMGKIKLSTEIQLRFSDLTIIMLVE